MQQTVGQRSVTAPAVVGMALVGIGALVLLTRAAGVDLLDSIGAWGWPAFIIVPGLALLGLSLVPTRPAGVGFATAGAIVTTVGLLLAYQARTGHWESWAYAWALLPTAAGLALVGYGLFSRQRPMLRSGLWMAGIGGSLFVAGAWYFERLFAGQLDGLDPSEWWPVILIAIGAVIAVRAIAVPRTQPQVQSDPPMQPGPSTPATPPASPQAPAPSA
jgi:hypothetical protein